MDVRGDIIWLVDRNGFVDNQPITDLASAKIKKGDVIERSDGLYEVTGTVHKLIERDGVVVVHTQHRASKVMS